MSLKHLEFEWKQLLGKDGVQLAAGTSASDDAENLLEIYAKQVGFSGPIRYLLSTKFEHCGLSNRARFNFSPVLVEVMQRCFSAMEAAHIPETESHILVALSPYKSFGAEVMRAKHGYVVLVSPVTFSLCFLFAVLAVTSAQATGLMEQGLVQRDEQGNALIDPFEWTYRSHQALGSAIQEFLENGTVLAPDEKIALARFDLLPWHYIERVQRTYEHMLDFLVLHEFGHIYLGHMRSMGTTRRVVPSTSISYEIATPLPKQEEAADDFALQCLVGTDNEGEARKIVSLLEQRDFHNPLLDKLWLGRTSIGRYTSAIQLLKLFDVFDYFLAQKSNKTTYTNLCEINATHPSGQHRFIRALFGDSNSQLPMLSRVFNRNNLLAWSNWVNLDAANHSREELRRWTDQLAKSSLNEAD